MSSSTPPLDSSSRVDDNSNSNSTSSETNNANPPDTSSATPLAPPPPSQETQISDAVPPPNNSSSSSNSSSNVAAAAPPQGLEENTQTPPTPNNSNSNSNLNNPPPPLPPQTSTPPSPVSTNIPNLGSPNPNPNSNSNSKTTPPPAIVSPTMPPPQAEKIMPVNPSPSQITPTNPSTPPPPPNQPTNQITSPVMQVLPNQTPPGLSPPQQANAQSLLPGVTPPPPPPFSSSIPSPLMHPSPNSAPVSNSFVTKSYEGVAPLFIVIGAVSVLVAILCVIGRKKKKQNDLVYYNEQHAKSDGVVYQHSYQYTATPPTDHMFGQPRTSTSSQTLSGNPTGSYKESYRAGYYPGMPTNNHTGAFSYEEITDMTGGFSCENLIGEGGFGCVYKGWVSDGRCVAVKQLKAGSGQGEREFQAEVEIISRIHHRHLVSLVGYCIVEHHRMLVYEFVPNSTLEHHLHGKGVPVMDWGKRLKIAIGSARGLAYLHEDCQPRIIHRDIKSANILLDYAFEAQVADFGLAKLSNDTYTHVSTRIMGTFGYLAPEYASSGKLTDRSDVFSFGVVLLELITGRKPIDANESLVEWARPLLVQALETHKTEELVDPRLENNYNRDDMFRMIEAAAACVRHSAPRRPRMVQVLRALESDLGHAVDLTNGIKVGQSMGFDPNQYPSSELQRFRQMAFSIEEEWSHEDGETPNRPFTRAVEPNFLIRDKSVK